MDKVLVVDDDQEIGFMLKLILEHRGFSVTVLERAENLEEIILRDNFDLIVLDMLIAGTKGTDVCTVLKSHPKIKSIPILMITAFPDSEKICLEAGADEFLSKPFEIKDLISKINLLAESS
ncbi:PleD family two-component system response regulator [Algoriphagus sp.]|uniref:response regulator n=1 Tax=Algoriphagus sp. TaxID=1872435 RepID=UPI002718DFF0|nr:response regulator [Algoriphagus sp.]MDO8965041.1 response regulator [Algoriphagus sp.]MDP3201850.1 response regulator [Algoriphagus sp.]